MAKRIEFDGKIHEFPDDFTDDDISKALKTASPTPSKPDIPGYGQPAYSNPPAPPMVASDTDLKRQGLAKNAFGDISDIGGGSFADQAGRQKHVWTESVPFLDTAAAIANKRPMAAVHRGLGDAMSVAAPFAAASMAAAPARSLLRIGAGGAAAQGTHAVANEMDLPPDAADLAGDAAGLLVGGPMGSRAFTGRAGALGKALPELLPSRFRTKYNLLSKAMASPSKAMASPSSLPEPVTSRSPVAFPDTPTTDINATRPPATLIPHDPTPNWEGMPEPIDRTPLRDVGLVSPSRPYAMPRPPLPDATPIPGSLPSGRVPGPAQMPTPAPKPQRTPLWANMQAEEAAQPTQLPPPVGAPRLPSGRVPGGIQSQLPPEIAPPQAQTQSGLPPRLGPDPANPNVIQGPPESAYPAENPNIATSPTPRKGKFKPQVSAGGKDAATELSRIMSDAQKLAELYTPEELAAKDPASLNRTPAELAQLVNRVRVIRGTRDLNEMMGRPSINPATGQLFK